MRRGVDPGGGSVMLWAAGHRYERRGCGVSRRGWVLFVAMCVIWGCPYLLIKVAVEELSPSTLVLARTVLGAALLLPFVVVRGQLRPVLARWRPLVAFSLIEICVPWLLLGLAERRLSSSLTECGKSVPVALTCSNRCSGAKFTTNSPVASTLSREFLRPTDVNCTIGGETQATVKNECGARLSTPSADTEETHAIGRGTTTAVISL